MSFMNCTGCLILDREYQSFRLPNGQVDGVSWLTCGVGALPGLLQFSIEYQQFRNGRFLSGLWEKMHICAHAQSFIAILLPLRQ